MNSKSKIDNNLSKINHSIDGRATLVAVSKYSTTLDIRDAYFAGHRDFGESRVQDLKKKSEYFLNTDDINWHFIGNLQTNKTKQLLQVEGLKFIHSVDSYKLLKEIDLKMKYFKGPKLNYFLQINTSDEVEKGGINEDSELDQILKFIQTSIQDKRLSFKGLMTIGSIRSSNFEKSALSSFKKLKEYKLEIEANYSFPELSLSMGMSQDYLLAIQEGSNYVRVGSSIFG